MPLIFHKKPALVVYVTCGDPDLATTREIVLAAIEAGAHVIEVGVRFSDPVAAGPGILPARARGIMGRGSSEPASGRLNTAPRWDRCSSWRLKFGSRRSRRD